MASRIRRSVSFSHPNSSPKTNHARSSSLPCRSHPLISQLEDEIKNLKIWEANPNLKTSAWLNEGLTMLKNVHDSFGDLLHLSQTRDSFRRRSEWVESLLEDYLRFVDVYGIFRASIVSIKEEQLKLEMSLRRNNESMISLYARERKKINKDMMKIVSSNVRFTGKYLIPVTTMVESNSADFELSNVLRDVNDVTQMVTMCLIKGVSSSIEIKRNSWKNLRNLWNNKKKTSDKEEGIKEVVEVIESLSDLRINGEGDKNRKDRSKALEKLERLDKCIEEIGNGRWKCNLNAAYGAYRVKFLHEEMVF
ncbi:hypothetical protein C5167_013869 [Papaver somniferum]|uniref:Uncharacterized protein n=1 Tax=Papaver somniferum TaxID=3469 RepID=A0A4Y7J509_PAPSO|nr:hypothetical protein C5167_013869 [Papaver somniferum]